jgi:hypothetical protein
MEHRVALFSPILPGGTLVGNLICEEPLSMTIPNLSDAALLSHATPQVFARGHPRLRQVRCPNRDSV